MHKKINDIVKKINYYINKFSKKPTQEIITKVLDEYYLEHSIISNTYKFCFKTTKTEILKETRNEIIERATKALNDNNKDELQKALLMPLLNVINQDPMLIFSSAKMADIEYFEIVMNSIMDKEVKYNQLFNLITIHGNINVIKKWFITTTPKPTAVLNTLPELFKNNRRNVIDLLFNDYKIRFGSFEKECLRNQVESNKESLLNNVRDDEELSDDVKEYRCLIIESNDGFNASKIISSINAYQEQNENQQLNKARSIYRPRENLKIPEHLKL